jgi:hypothetical protein
MRPARPLLDPFSLAREYLLSVAPNSFAGLLQRDDITATVYLAPSSPDFETGISLENLVDAASEAIRHNLTLSLTRVKYSLRYLESIKSQAVRTLPAECSHREGIYIAKNLVYVYVDESYLSACDLRLVPYDAILVKPLKPWILL